ncbi:MAG: SMP-30/gluconolactonase/LRE family protein [Limisphaerales bacterium]
MGARPAHARRGSGRPPAVLRPRQQRHLPPDAGRRRRRVPHQVRLRRRGHQRPPPGRSNGLALDAQGRLTVCQHGHQRVARLELNGLTTVLADRFEGRRLNSPNDLVYRSDGALFFTDPPFGLPKFGDDPRRELAHAGVYPVKDGEVRLVSRDFGGPNGLAFSPDEQWLYVGNWDERRKVVFPYPVRPDATLGRGEPFCDLTGAPGDDAIDGV